MFNVGLIKFRKIHREEGDLTPIESLRDIPFEIKRVYYIYNVPDGALRGAHAHRRLHEVLVCLHGSMKVDCEFCGQKVTYELNDPTVGLYMGPYVWINMYDFSNDAVCVVFASDYYDESDYIRDYSVFLEESKNMFRL
uniref:WxcM-like domain-containing protein n=1 Tax=Fervidobacterium pennivorans TaxID=93466 RepID=A0A7C4VV11_FERPE